MSRGDGWKQRQRVDVPVLLLGDANAEVHGRDRVLGLTAPADQPDDRSLRHRPAAFDLDLPEVQKGQRVAVGRLDGHGPAASGDSSGERDDTCPGRADRCALRRADVDAAVLPGDVRVVTRGERLQQRTVDRPRPGGSGRGNDQQQESHEGQQHDCSAHVRPPCCLDCEHHRS